MIQISVLWREFFVQVFMKHLLKMTFSPEINKFTVEFRLELTILCIAHPFCEIYGCYIRKVCRNRSREKNESIIRVSAYIVYYHWPTLLLTCNLYGKIDGKISTTKTLNNFPVKQHWNWIIWKIYLFIYISLKRTIHNIIHTFRQHSLAVHKNCEGFLIDWIATFSIHFWKLLEIRRTKKTNRTGFKIQFRPMNRQVYVVRSMDSHRLVNGNIFVNTSHYILRILYLSTSEKSYLHRVCIVGSDCYFSSNTDTMCHYSLTIMLSRHIWFHVA